MTECPGQQLTVQLPVEALNWLGNSYSSDYSLANGHWPLALPFSAESHRTFIHAGSHTVHDLFFERIEYMWLNWSRKLFHLVIEIMYSHAQSLT